MKLLGNRVIIEPIIEEKRGSIILARMSRQMPDRGIVRIISDQAALETGVKVGDMVIYDMHHQQLSGDQKTTMIEGQHLKAILT